MVFCGETQNRRKQRDAVLKKSCVIMATSGIDLSSTSTVHYRWKKQTGVLINRVEEHYLRDDISLGEDLSNLKLDYAKSPIIEAHVEGWKRTRTVSIRCAAAMMALEDFWGLNATATLLDPMECNERKACRLRSDRGHASRSARTFSYCDAFLHPGRCHAGRFRGGV